jgi:hypothetical protein
MRTKRKGVKGREEREKPGVKEERIGSERVLNDRFFIVVQETREC